MIKRIVQMTFDPKNIETFKDIFNSVHSNILDFDGCYKVELYTDLRHPNIMYTISIWDSEKKLNDYRNSDLFKKTWRETKSLFCAPPKANSLSQIPIQF